jgi:hypothetical protein
VEITTVVIQQVKALKFKICTGFSVIDSVRLSQPTFPQENSD